MNINRTIITKEQTDYLIKNYNNVEVKEIASYLGLEEGIVAMELRALNLKKRTFKRFSQEELDIINAHYKYVNYSELSKILKRNRSVVFNKIKELGLDKEPSEAELYKLCICGLEDSIMFLSCNLAYSNKDILELITKEIPHNQLTNEMIETFLFFNKKDYKSKWLLFDKSFDL